MTSNKKESVCTNCGFVGKPGKETKGSILIEIILWFFFILPGLIYSLWRLSTRKPVCPKCKQQTMIPTDTPKGQQLMSQKAV